MDIERHLIEVENYEKYHINLAKVKEKYYNINERENLTKLEKELLILVLDKKEEIKKISKGDRELMEAGKRIEDMSFDINMIGLYDVEEDRKITDALKTRYKMKKATEEGLKKGMEEGLQKGMEEGVKQGIEQGLEKGIKQGLEQGIERGKHQGRYEGQEVAKIEIAQKMVKNGISEELISECTGLSINEIKNIN